MIFFPFKKKKKKKKKKTKQNKKKKTPKISFTKDRITLFNDFPKN